jgi:hypothetical protein
VLKKTRRASRRRQPALSIMACSILDHRDARSIPEFSPDTNPAEFRRQREKFKAQLIYRLDFLGLGGSLEFSPS